MKTMKRTLALLLAGTLTVGPAAAAFAEEEPAAVAIDAEAFDALLASGPVAEDADIEASEWASKVKEAGTLRVGAGTTDPVWNFPFDPALDDPDLAGCEGSGALEVPDEALFGAG